MFQTLALAVALGAALHSPFLKTHSKASVTAYQGTFSDGATYLIQVPSPWNGTFVLYSHGYVAPGQPNPAYDVGDSNTGNYLLAQGYALGGSSYASTGWAVQQALPDQLQVISTFVGIAGQPKRTVAWGHSMGGLVTAGLVQQYPTLFTGALPMCGVVGGGVGIWNGALDGAFVFNTLLAGGALSVVNISNPGANYYAAISALNSAQNSAQGQARIALAAAVADTPGWYDTGYPPPAPTDYTDQEANQYSWFSQVDFLFDFYLRAELEGRAGGNPSFNTGVNYKKQLAKSVNRAEVEALYKTAGLSLDADLATLQSTARISANPASLTYLSDNIIFDGMIPVPVLTLHTEGDGLVVNENESAYKDVVHSTGDGALLKQLFVYRAGHCAFTSAEEIAAFTALIDRLNSGHWRGLDAAQLNLAAQNLGSAYNPYPPGFQKFSPPPFLDTYDGTPP